MRAKTHPNTDTLPPTRSHCLAAAFPMWTIFYQTTTVHLGSRNKALNWREKLVIWDGVFSLWSYTGERDVHRRNMPKHSLGLVFFVIIFQSTYSIKGMERFQDPPDSAGNNVKLALEQWQEQKWL